MVPLRLGVVNFLNAYPLWAALEGEPGITLVPDVPSRLALELRAGNLDAALISSVEYLRHPGGFTFHPGLCISATQESKSIRLFVRDASQDFRVAAPSWNPIFTDAASRSSVAQLGVILQELNLAPHLEEVEAAGERIPTLRDHEALLAIGDTALSHMARPSYDLQQAYFGIFSHGFVYALWVMHEAKSAQVAPLLTQAYGKYQQDSESYRSRAASRFSFSASFVQEYLAKIIHHDMTAERRRDLDFFAAKLAKLPPH